MSNLTATPEITIFWTVSIQRQDAQGTFWVSQDVRALDADSAISVALGEAPKGIILHALAVPADNQSSW